MRFKRIRRQNREIDEMDRFGITRMGSSWTIRLGWHNRKPKFQEKIYDADYDGDAKKAFLKAVEIVQANKDKYQSDFQPETNLIKGLILSRHKNASGKSYYWRWQVSFRADGKAKSKTFGFWNTGKIYETYLKAVDFVMGLGISVDLDKVDDFFSRYSQKITESEFWERSDINALESEVSKTILKSRYFK